MTTTHGTLSGPPPRQEPEPQSWHRAPLLLSLSTASCTGSGAGGHAGPGCHRPNLPSLAC